MHDPVTKQELVQKKSQKAIAELLKEDNELMLAAEQDFTNPTIHDRYIGHHFQIPTYWTDSSGNSALRDDFTLQNFYTDKLEFTDSLYVDMGRLGLGIFNYRVDSLDKALKFFSLIKDRKTPFINYYSSVIYWEKGDTTMTLMFLKRAIAVTDRFRGRAFVLYIDLLEKTSNYAVLTDLLYHPATRKYIPQDLAIQLYFRAGDLINYYRSIFLKLFSHFKWTGLLAAFVIMMVWLSYIMRIDVFEREKTFPIFMTLVCGMISVTLVFLIRDFNEVILGWGHNAPFWNQLMYYIFEVGLVEECCKILPLLFILVFFPRLVNEAYDYLLYACISALGFAFIENLLYFQQDLSSIIFKRAMTSVPGHMMDSSIVAYGFVLSRYRYKKFPLYFAFPLFLLLGAIAHGLYDFWAVTNTLPFFILNLLISLSIWVIIINNSINNSPHFSYRMKFRSAHLQSFMSIALTSILALQYLIVSWEIGPASANSSLNGTLFIGGIFIVFYTDKLTNMDLVKGYWNTISYKTIGDKRRNTSFSIKMFFIRLVSGDIVPHTFVGNKIYLACGPDNPDLQKIFSTKVKGEVIDRLVVTCTTKDQGEEYKDPYWFMVKAEGPVFIGSTARTYFLFRFVDDNPSFERVQEIPIYLFLASAHDLPDTENVHRKELRSLGKAFLAKRV